MLVIVILFLSYFASKLARDAFRLNRQTGDPLWLVRGFALAEPIISGMVGTGILYGAWRTNPWFAPLVIVSPLIFGFFVHRYGRYRTEGREIARNMFIRGVLGICSTLYMFLFAIDYLDDQYALWRWVVCWLVISLVGFMTAVFIGRQSKEMRREHLRLENRYSIQPNRPQIALPQDDTHDWSAQEEVLKQLKEEEKVTLK